MSRCVSITLSLKINRLINYWYLRSEWIFKLNVKLGLTLDFQFTFSNECTEKMLLVGGWPHDTQATPCWPGRCPWLIKSLPRGSPMGRWRSRWRAACRWSKRRWHEKKERGWRTRKNTRERRSWRQGWNAAWAGGSDAGIRRWRNGAHRDSNKPSSWYRREGRRCRRHIWKEPEFSQRLNIGQKWVYYVGQFTEKNGSPCNQIRPRWSTSLIMSIIN